jgi:hypothetical protein
MLSARLGVATGKHMAELCREHYPRPASMLLWVSEPACAYVWGRGRAQVPTCVWAAGLYLVQEIWILSTMMSATTCLRSRAATSP